METEPERKELDGAGAAEAVEVMARAMYEADDAWAAAFPWPDLGEIGKADGYRLVARAALHAYDGELREAAQHLLDVGEFCRTDDTESALRRLRAALSSRLSATTPPEPEPVDELDKAAVVEVMARAVYDDQPHTAMSQALAEATGLPLNASIPYETAIAAGYDNSPLKHMLSVALDAALPLLTAQRGLTLTKEGVGEAMRRACIEAVSAEKRYESSDFPVCNSIINAIQAIDVTALAGGKTEGGA